MAKMHLQEKNDTLILAVQGPLSILDAPALRGCFLEAASSLRDLRLDLTGVEAIDLACVQVICAAHRTYFGRGAGISLMGEVPGGVLRTVAVLGLTPGACTGRPHGVCLWDAGGNHE